MTGVQARHACFRAVLTALAYPGRPQALPVPAEQAPRLILESVWEASQLGQDVFLLEADTADLDLAALPRGDEERPEAGATVIVSAAGGSALTEGWIEGPGVRARARVSLPVSSHLLSQRDKACAEPPAGIDLLIVADGSVTGLPRTTRLALD